MLLLRLEHRGSLLFLLFPSSRSRALIGRLSSQQVLLSRIEGIFAVTQFRLSCCTAPAERSQLFQTALCIGRRDLQRLNSRLRLFHVFTPGRLKLRQLRRASFRQRLLLLQFQIRGFHPQLRQQSPGRDKLTHLHRKLRHDSIRTRCHHAEMPRSHIARRSKFGRYVIFADHLRSHQRRWSASCSCRTTSSSDLRRPSIAATARKTHRQKCHREKPGNE